MRDKIIAKSAAAILGFIWLSGCAMRPPIPDNVGEDFVPERDLVGNIVAKGGFSAIDGTDREFVAYIDGSWDGNVLTLVEDFEFADGVKERKTWVLTQQANGEFSGIREDLIGTARGYQDGAAFRLDYTMALPNEDGSPGRKMKFRDVLVNDSDGNIINNATVGWWGFRVATVNLTMERQDAASSLDSKDAASNIRYPTTRVSTLSPSLDLPAQ